MNDAFLIDLFPAFLTYWEQVREQPLDERIERWAMEYLASWPELLEKQTADYATQGLDWKQIARERIFPFLDERLPAMQEAHDNLLKQYTQVHVRAQQALGFSSDVTYIVYVGIGCGAGWATSLGDTPAILFGLESIAERNWTNETVLAGLTAHEIGHLVHYYWRKQHNKAMGSGPWWQLYEEGFAQQCASRVVGKEAWHQELGHPGWMAWCQRCLRWLATEFLKTVDTEQSAASFFGSWFDICGRSETGHFLGYKALEQLEKEKSLLDIALLDDPEATLRPILNTMITSASRHW